MKDVKGQKISVEENSAFQKMMKDLLFGANGFCKDVPAKGKAAALNIIDNTELYKRDK